MLHNSIIVFGRNNAHTHTVFITDSALHAL